MPARIPPVAERRLSSQGLHAEGLGRPEDVVRHMGAMQAQDVGQALWAIAVRTPTASIAEVETAIAERRIVRTWPMRSTLHVVAPENARWMTALSAPRRVAAAQGRLAQLELDAAVLARSLALFEGALRGGKRLTRPAMLALLDEAGISTEGQRGYHMLWHAAQTGLTCFGPMDGKQPTFVLLDEWVPGAKTLPPDEALAELARLYFTSHGPATVQDFAWWSGAGLIEARRGLAAATGLAREVIAGVEHWGGTAPVAAPRPVLLLPGFDETLLGYKDRSAGLDADHAPRIVPGNNGMFKATVAIDGRVAGTWRKKVAKKALVVEIEPFVPLDGHKPALDAEAERLARAYGLPLGGCVLVD